MTCPNSFIQWFAQLYGLSKLCRPWWMIQSVIQYQTHKIRNIYNAYTVLCAVEFSRVFLAPQRNVTGLALGSVSLCLCGFGIMDSGHSGREWGAAHCSTVSRCLNQTVSPPAPMELLLKHDRGLNAFKKHFRKTRSERTNPLLSRLSYSLERHSGMCDILTIFWGPRSSSPLCSQSLGNDQADLWPLSSTDRLCHFLALEALTLVTLFFFLLLSLVCGETLLLQSCWVFSLKCTFQ